MLLWQFAEQIGYSVPCYHDSIGLRFILVADARGSRLRLPEILQVSLLSQPSKQTAVSSGQNGQEIAF
jgi:hypothetical protein